MKNEFFLYKNVLSIRSYTGGNSFFLIFLRHFFLRPFPLQAGKTYERVCEEYLYIVHFGNVRVRNKLFIL